MKKNHWSYVRTSGLAAVIIAGATLMLADWLSAAEKPLHPQKDLAASRAAFLKAYTVFMHPRCMNCHPDGNVPLQGEDSHLHLQNVQRGPDGKGLYALKCANCHQPVNLVGPHLPPGNTNWSLPPADMPMPFQHRTPAQLARQMLDPKQNNHRRPEQLIEHVEHEPLVTGAWVPANGRPLPPMSHEEFVQAVKDWIEKGAAIPE